VPGAQGEPAHAVLPAEADQVPATHGVQGVALVAPTAENVPAAQIEPRQLAAPLAG